jgi:hypothetical protein
VICQSTIRRFDGDATATLHTAILPRAATDLRFIAWVTIDKGTSTYARDTDAPAVTIAWVPAERIHDEASSPTEIDAALANPDQIPLVVLARRERAVAYISDSGSSFPVVGIKGTSMVLAVRLAAIAAGTHGQLTFGWMGDRC